MQPLLLSSLKYLIFPQGAGKSTLLRVVAGKNLTKSPILALGKDVFKEGSTGITYLGTEWANNPVVRGELPVSRLLKTLGAERHPVRCAELLEIMDVRYLIFGSGFTQRGLG